MGVYWVQGESSVTVENWRRDLKKSFPAIVLVFSTLILGFRNRRLIECI